MSIWIAFHLSQFGEINGAISLKLTPEKSLNWYFWRWFFMEKNCLAYLVETVLHMPKSNDTQWPKSILHGSKTPFYILKWSSVFFLLKTQKKTVQKTISSTHGFFTWKLKTNTFFLLLNYSWETEKETGRRTSCFSDLNMWTEVEKHSWNFFDRKHCATARWRRRRGAFGSWWWWSWWCERRRRSDSNETRERFQTCSDPENLNWHPPPASSKTGGANGHHFASH